MARLIELFGRLDANVYCTSAAYMQYREIAADHCPHRRKFANWGVPRRTWWQLHANKVGCRLSVGPGDQHWNSALDERVRRRATEDGKVVGHENTVLATISHVHANPTWNVL